LGGRPPRALLTPEFAPTLAGSRLDERDADRGQGDRDQEAHEPVHVEDVSEHPAEQARGDADQRRLQEADLLPPRQHEPSERADDQACQHEPEQLEREADQRAREQSTRMITTRIAITGTAGKVAKRYAPTSSASRAASVV
jgi:hypothetical protein